MFRICNWSLATNNINTRPVEACAVMVEKCCHNLQSNATQATVSSEMIIEILTDDKDNTFDEEETSDVGKYLLQKGESFLMLIQNK